MYDGTQRAGIPRKLKPRGQHPDKRLSAAFVRNAPVGRHCDGNGLYLVVKPTGTRSWIQRIAIRGRRRDIGLGSVRLVPLAEAREKASSTASSPATAETRSPTAAAPSAYPCSPPPPNASGTSCGRAGATRGTPATGGGASRTSVLPRIGQRPVSEVTAADVLEILEPIWHSKPKTARRLRQRIRAVLEWAVALEHRADNPCDRLGPVLGPHDLAVRHFRALPHAEAGGGGRGGARLADAAGPQAGVRVPRVDGWALGRGARGAVGEVDTSAHVWTVPATRMKAKREHRVPLCGRAVEILDAAADARRRRQPAPCSPARAAGPCPTRRSTPSSRSTESPPCHMASDPASGTGRPRRPTTRARSSRRLWPMWCRTRSRRPTPFGPVRAAADSDERLGSLSRRHTPSSPDRGTSGTRTRRNRSILTTSEPDPILLLCSTTHRPQQVSRAEIANGHQVQYGSGGEGHRAGRRT